MDWNLVQNYSVLDRTSQIMDLIIQHEYYKEVLSEKWLGRDVEKDGIDADHEEEKHYG